VAERLNASVLKTDEGASPPWVRIPPHPPFLLADIRFHIRMPGTFPIRNILLQDSAQGFRDVVIVEQFLLAQDAVLIGVGFVKISKRCGCKFVLNHNEETRLLHKKH
jgi:hypothetical protein